MFTFISELGQFVLLQICEVTIGVIAAFVIVRFLKESSLARRLGKLPKLLLVLLSALCGVCMPLGTYGILPIFAALISLAISWEILIPFFLSNMIFNTLLPFTDANFVWRASGNRILLALTIGIAAGLLLQCLKLPSERFIRGEALQSIASRPELKFSGMVKKVGGVMNALGLFIIIGSLFSVIFYRYLYVDFVGGIYTGSLGAFAMGIFKGRNITGPFFVLATTLTTNLMDFLKLSALLFVFKWRGVISYYAYTAVWTGLLVLMIFIS